MPANRLPGPLGIGGARSSGVAERGRVDGPTVVVKDAAATGLAPTAGTGDAAALGLGFAAGDAAAG